MADEFKLRTTQQRALDHGLICCLADVMDAIQNEILKRIVLACEILQATFSY